MVFTCPLMKLLDLGYEGDGVMCSICWERWYIVDEKMFWLFIF